MLAPSSVPTVSAPLSASFNVARARRLFAGRGDLFGNVRRRDDALRQRNPIVRHKDDLQAVADALVAIDVLADEIDGTDDILGDIIARRGLGRKQEHPRADVERRVLKQAAVQGQNVKQIQVLAFVFVQPLDLHVEDRIGRDLHAALALDERRQVGFVSRLTAMNSRRKAASSHTSPTRGGG